MKLLCLVLLLSSCNVTKILTDGETKVDDGFFDNSKTPEETTTPEVYEKNLIFFECGNSPCFLDTSTNLVETIPGPLSITLSSPANYNYFDSAIFFTAYNGTNTSLFKYDLVSKTTLEISLFGSNNSDPRKFVKYSGDLYFLAKTTAETTGTLCKIVVGNNTPDCRGTYITSDAYYLAASTSGLFVCYQSAGDRLHTIAMDGSFTKTVITSPAVISCSSLLTAKAHISNQFLFDLAYTNSFVRYNTSLNTSETVNFGAAPSTLSLEHDGTTAYFFFSDGAQLYYMTETSIITSPLEITAVTGNYNPSIRLIQATPDGFLFTDNDAVSNPQVFQVNKDNTNLYNVTNFSSNTAILYFRGMSRGLYIFNYSTIYFYANDGTTETISTSNISNTHFETIWEHEMN
ncbi:MAG: hypothetical protein HON90_16750 [Halobacteriovoraceae bacterium]|jgi:hypothetical protein|nr:hypothetical protein [Halobacteriovoraceae bacterium]